MAQLKDRPEPETWYDRMHREEREFNEKHPILDTRYFVQEWQSYPDVYVGDEGENPPQKCIHVYGPFNEEELGKWLEKHAPERNCHFIKKRENLRHYSYDKWGR